MQGSSDFQKFPDKPDSIILVIVYSEISATDFTCVFPQDLAATFISKAK